MKNSSEIKKTNQNIKAICKVLSNKPTLPILGTVKVISKGLDTPVRLTSCNLEVWVETEIQMNIPEGKYLLTKASLKSLMKIDFEKLPKVDISIDEFPDKPKFDSSKTLVKTTLNRDGIIPVFKNALRFTNKDTTRTWANGVAFTGNRIIVAGAKRLYLREVTSNNILDQPVIIPSGTLQAMIEIAWDDTIIFETDGKTMFKFSDGTNELIGYLIDCKFPDYQRVIPDYSNYREIHLTGDDIKIFNDELKTAISLFKGNHILKDMVKLSVDNGIFTMSIDKNKNEKWEYISTIPTSAIHDDNYDIAVNWNHLKSILDNYKGVDIVIRFIDKPVSNLSPLLIFPEIYEMTQTENLNHPNDLIVQMPKRLN